MPDPPAAQQWLQYINSLPVEEAQSLQQHYLPTAGQISRQKLGQALYRLISQPEFLHQQLLTADERRVLALLYHQPSPFGELKEATGLCPLQLGMVLARLRSRLLLGKDDRLYFIPQPVEQSGQPHIRDLFVCPSQSATDAGGGPWLNEALLLAAASFFLQGGKGEALFAQPPPDWQQRLLLKVLLACRLLTETADGFRPLPPSAALTQLPTDHRHWLYWSLACGLGATELYPILYPLRHLPPFTGNSWARWLHRFHRIPPARQHALTSTLVELGLLVEVSPELWAVHPQLESTLKKGGPPALVRLPALLEFHVDAAQLTLPLAALTLCCRLKHFDRVAVFVLEPQRFLQLVSSLHPAGFAHWLAAIGQAGVKVDPTAQEQLRLCYQDGQRAQLWPAVTVLRCDPSLSPMVEQLPGLSSYLLFPPTGGLFVFDPNREGWRTLLADAGINPQDAQQPAVAPPPPLAEEWPPPLPAFDYQGPRPPVADSQEVSPPRPGTNRAASGINYRAKKQLLSSLVDEGKKLANIRYLGREDQPLLLVLPLSVEKSEQGDVLKAYDARSHSLLQLEIGKMTQISEHGYALLCEPLRQHWIQSTM